MDIKKNAVKGLVAGAFLLSTAGTSLAKGGKSDYGVKRLTQDILPAQNAVFCDVSTEDYTAGKTGEAQEPSQDQGVIQLMVDPEQDMPIDLDFMVAEIRPSDNPQALLLLAGTELAPAPELPLPAAEIPLKIALGSLRLLGVYDVPQLMPQPQQGADIGYAEADAGAIFKMKVHLNTGMLANLMEMGQNEIYFQAALMPKPDLMTGTLERVIMSELDTIRLLSPQECTGESWVADESGEMTKGGGGEGMEEETDSSGKTGGEDTSHEEESGSSSSGGKTD